MLQESLLYVYFNEDEFLGVKNKFIYYCDQLIYLTILLFIYLSYPPKYLSFYLSIHLSRSLYLASEECTSVHETICNAK